MRIDKYILHELSYRRKMRVRELVQYEEGLIFPRCPKCRIAIEREYMNFCDRCGQKLSWRRFNKAKIK